MFNTGASRHLIMSGVSAFITGALRRAVLHGVSMFSRAHVGFPPDSPVSPTQEKHAI